MKTVQLPEDVSPAIAIPERPTTSPELTLNQSMLDTVMPLHIRVAPDLRVIGAGATMLKLLGSDRLAQGPHLFDLFEVRRPRKAHDLAGLLAAGDGASHLRLALPWDRGTQFKGLAVALDDGGALINLSFGISLFDAVRRHSLTSDDFAATDLAIEMLFLREAQSAALAESQRLNLRLQGAKAAAENDAATDMLTGLRNRRAAEALLERLWANETPFAVMHLDLDFFKEVNDTHGHAAGDRVLQVAAERLSRVGRNNDVVGRIGGDEFLMVFESLVQTTRLAEIASRVIQDLEQPIHWNGLELNISCSVGIATTDHPGGKEADDLVRAADAALYVSKRAGRGTYSFAERTDDTETLKA